VTESSFTVQWKPGFDNGREQFFILKYRKESQQRWAIVSIPYTGGTLMNYTASALSSGANYQVVLYASNIIGDSSETDMLHISTKGLSFCREFSRLYLYSIPLKHCLFKKLLYHFESLYGLRFTVFYRCIHTVPHLSSTTDYNVNI
jgi:hypothetical protein